MPSPCPLHTLVLLIERRMCLDWIFLRRRQATLSADFYTRGAATITSTDVPHQAYSSGI